jgi:hypothetical protein
LTVYSCVSSVGYPIANYLPLVKNLNSSNSFLCYATGRENEAFLKDLEAEGDLSIQVTG